MSEQKIPITIYVNEDELDRLGLLTVDFSAEEMSIKEYVAGIVRHHLKAKFTTSASYAGSHLFQELLNRAKRTGTITITAELMEEIQHEIMEYKLAHWLRPNL